MTRYASGNGVRSSVKFPPDPVDLLAQSAESRRAGHVDLPAGPGARRRRWLIRASLRRSERRGVVGGAVRTPPTAAGAAMARVMGAAVGGPPRAPPGEAGSAARPGGSRPERSR